MFAARCPAEGRSVLLSERRIIGISLTEDAASIRFRCWCGAVGTVDRPASRPPLDAGRRLTVRRGSRVPFERRSRGRLPGTVDGQCHSMLIRRVARPLLSAVFVTGGVDALRDPAGKAKGAQPVVDQINAYFGPAAEKAAANAAPLADKARDAATDAVDADAVGGAADAVVEPIHEVARGGVFPLDAETYVKVNGAAMLGAGALLAIGRLPRLSSAVLAATLVPTTFGGHRFWEITDPDERTAQRIHFMKNISLIGGLILAALDTEGAPGVAWRARRAQRDAQRAARTARREAKLLAKATAAEVHRRAADLPGPLR